MKQETLNANKGENSSLLTWPGAAKKSCANTSRLWQHCGLKSKLTSCMESSASRRKMSCHARRRCRSPCASQSLKVWIERCSLLSNTKRRSISTQRFTSSPRPLTLREGYRRTPSTTTGAKQSPASLRRSSASSLTGRAGMRCRAPRRRASGSSTSGPESSAGRSDFKLSLIRGWTATSRSLNSRRDWSGGALG